MKAILAALAVLLVFASQASAIPQTFSGNGFLGAVGMPFEQYVATVAVWAPGSELKGPWKARNGKSGGVETYDLGTDAAVFGILAAQVTAERAEGVVRRFTVRFDEAKLKGGKARNGGLYEQVLANVTALAGAARQVSSVGDKTFRHESSLITVSKSGGREVIVEFTPAR